MRPPFKVIAVGSALVNDDVALRNGDRFRFVGRSPTASPREGSPDAPDERPLDERFPPLEREYPDDASHRYILKALRTGDLVARSEHGIARAGHSEQTGRASRWVAIQRRGSAREGRAAHTKAARASVERW